VVGQGSAGDRRPYADLTDNPEVGFPQIAGVNRRFRNRNGTTLETRGFATV
jgi:hypothetical protein